METRAKSAESNSPLKVVGGIAGALVGYALARYCGLALFLPFGFAVVVLLMFSKLPFRPRGHALAISLVLGHLLWIAFGATVAGTAGVWSAIDLDLAAFGAAAAWLWVRPTRPAVVTLAVLELLALAANAYGLSRAGADLPASRALVVHCLLRALVLYALATESGRRRRLLERRSATEPAFPDVKIG